MILPIIGYGNPILKITSKDINNSYPNLKKNALLTIEKSRGAKVNG